MENDKMSHPIYKKCCRSDSDATAWVFPDNQTFCKYFYKHPKLEENEIRCRVLYSGLCMSDSFSGRGSWGKKIRPLCAGHEVVAEIEAMGSNVTGFEIGEKVGFGPFRQACMQCEFCLEGSTNACQELTYNEKKLYALYFGGYSTYIQQPTTVAYKIPEGLRLECVAPLLCAGVTVFTPLRELVKPGMRVGVIGIGGLGHLAVQYAHKMGATVDAFSRSDKKLSLAKQLGAQGIVIWKQKDYHLNLKNTYHVIINTISQGITKEEFSNFSYILRPYGRFVQVGLPPSSIDLNISYKSIVGKQIGIIGSNVGGRKHTEEMLEFSAKHGVECLCEFFEFEDFPKALEVLEKGSPKFRCVVKTHKVTDK